MTLFSSQKPRKFEENPKYMNRKDILYLGYKYYGRNTTNGKKLNSPLLLDKALKWESKFPLQNKVTLHIGGDLMPYEFINNNNARNFWEFNKGFFEADMVIANLESPIDLSKKPQLVPEVMFKDMNFNCSQEQFNIFNGSQKGFDVLSIANNHSLDMGYEGLNSSIQFLSKKNIGYCGAGKGKTYCIKEIRGVKIGVMSFTFSLNQYTPDPSEDIKINMGRFNKPMSSISDIKKQASQLKDEGADYIILMLHAGNAYQPYPGKQTQELFSNITQQTQVDFIAGHHPHNIQGLEEFKVGNKTKIGAYSLGDFVAYDVYQRSHLNMYLQLEIGFQNKKAQINSLKVKLNYLEYAKKELKLIPFEMAKQKYKGSSKIKDLELLCRQTLTDIE